MEIRNAHSPDTGGIVDIYNHYVTHGTSTFDETPVSVGQGLRWCDQFAAQGPHRLLVAVDDGHIAGYACSGAYRDHPSFAATVEFTVYLDPAQVGRGLGTSLYERLLDDLAGEGLHRAVVGIALPNDASVRLHRRVGFEDVGVFDEYATKAGRRISSLWMQRPL